MLIANVCFVGSLSKSDAYCILDLDVGWVGFFLFLTYILSFVFHELTAGGNVEPQF